MCTLKDTIEHILNTAFESLQSFSGDAAFTHTFSCKAGSV